MQKSEKDLIKTESQSSVQKVATLLNTRKKGFTIWRIDLKTI